VIIKHEHTTKLIDGYSSSQLVNNMSDAPIQELWPEEATFCFGCGKNNRHGLQLQSYWEDEETVATWTPKEHHIAFPGVMNGGIISTLIDCHTTGTANAAAHKDANDLNHFMFVTGSLSVRFLKPTPTDKPVTLRARVEEKSEKRIRVSCDFYSGDTKTATGETVCFRVDLTDFLGK
jgi:acyl-coenzyme A thioesterase PaaI-like protein